VVQAKAMVIQISQGNAQAERGQLNIHSARRFFDLLTRVLLSLTHFTAALTDTLNNVAIAQGRSENKWTRKFVDD
jgi:hypothetical protein